MAQALKRLAGAALLILLAITAGLYLLAVPLKYAELAAVCGSVAADCPSPRLTPALAAELTAHGLSLPVYAGYIVGSRLAAALVSWALALLLLVRRPGERIVQVTALFLITFATVGAGVLRALPAVYPTLWLPVQAVNYLGWVSFPLFFLVFPSGRPVPGPRYTWPIVLVVAAFFVPGYFFPTSAITAFIDSTALAGVLFPTLFALCFGAQIYRYRRVSTPSERQQTKWVVLGVVWGLGGGIVASVAVMLAAGLEVTRIGQPNTPLLIGLDFIVSVIGLSLMLPLPLAVSVARYRLFDIDVLIQRTLVYSALTALLALTYFGLVISLQSLVTALGGRQADWVTVASTLAVAALILPLRNRVQAFIDKRFYRRKYDAAKTLAAFAAVARDETDLNTLTGQLAGVVQETMEPENLSVWIKPAGGRPPIHEGS